METGKHDFSGSCAPRDGDDAGPMSCGQHTFSLGVFQWVTKAGGKGCKKSAVKVRVYGPCHNSENVYAKAREIVALLDAGGYSGPKRVRA
jgi:hypothetical protein